MKTLFDKKTRKSMTITPEHCIGCRTCELACAFSHQAGAEFKPAKPRIYIRKTGEECFIPLVCLQCDEAACVSACLFGSMYKIEEAGTVEHDKDRCVGCLACLSACPFGNIVLDDDNFHVLKCDLCNGDPMCARFCPTEALTTG